MASRPPEIAAAFLALCWREARGAEGGLGLLAEKSRQFAVINDILEAEFIRPSIYVAVRVKAPWRWHTEFKRLELAPRRSVPEGAHWRRIRHKLAFRAELRIRTLRLSYCRMNDKER